MTQKTWDRILFLAERLVIIAEARWTPVYEVTPNAEVWKRGDPQIAETPKEYRDLPNTSVAPGKFESIVNKSRQRPPSAG